MSRRIKDFLYLLSDDTFLASIRFIDFQSRYLLVKRKFWNTLLSTFDIRSPSTFSKILRELYLIRLASVSETKLKSWFIKRLSGSYVDFKNVARYYNAVLAEESSRLKRAITKQKKSNSFRYFENKGYRYYLYIRNLSRMENKHLHDVCKSKKEENEDDVSIDTHDTASDYDDSDDNDLNDKKNHSQQNHQNDEIEIEIYEYSSENDNLDTSHDRKGKSKESDSQQIHDNYVDLDSDVSSAYDDDGVSRSVFRTQSQHEFFSELSDRNRSYIDEYDYYDYTQHAPDSLHPGKVKPSLVPVTVREVSYDRQVREVYIPTEMADDAISSIRDMYGDNVAIEQTANDNYIVTTTEPVVKYDTILVPPKFRD